MIRVYNINNEINMIDDKIKIDGIKLLEANKLAKSLLDKFANIKAKKLKNLAKSKRLNFK